MSSSTEKTDLFTTCEFKENLKVLRQIYLFSRFPIDSLKVFAYLCAKEHFKKGEYLFKQDDDDGQAFYLLSGSARLIRETPDGEMVIRDYPEETFIGGMMLLSRIRRLYSLKAAEDLSCLVLSREKFQKAMEQFPDLMPKVTRALIEQVFAWEEHFLVHRADTYEECIQKGGLSLI